jgi:antitoxin ParD1/3/4
MAAAAPLILTEPYSTFVQQQIDDGHYGTASEVVESGLRLLQARDARVAAVRAALIEGEESGPSRPFDFHAFRARNGASHLPTK